MTSKAERGQVSAWAQRAACAQARYGLVRLAAPPPTGLVLTTLEPAILLAPPALPSSATLNVAASSRPGREARIANVRPLACYVRSGIPADEAQAVAG